MASVTRARALSADQRLRALGTVIGAAAGDALGAPYEFHPPIALSEEVAMVGGGMLDWEPAEWTDDTAMSVVILTVAAESVGKCRLSSPQALDQIAAGWYRWSLNTPDIGVLTSSVISQAVARAAKESRPVPSHTDLHVAAQEIHDTEPLTAGNGSLMRTHAVVPGALHLSPEQLTEDVLAVGSLTHCDPQTDDATVLWSHAVRHAILTGEIVFDAGLEHIPAERRDEWQARITEAEELPPFYFSRNGWVVHAFQAACSAIIHAGDVPEDKFAQRRYLSAVLDGAGRSGFDTDTVACTAGALVGAALGANAVDPTWRRELHGWPEYRIDDLEALVDRVLDRVDEALAAG